jgi:hypothetical protein
MSSLTTISNNTIQIEKHICDICKSEKICLSFCDSCEVYNFCKYCIIKEIDNVKATEIS